MNKVDRHVGWRLQKARHSIRLSKASLAACLGVTEDQLADYEEGRARVSASKLYECSRVLRVSVSFFFEGYSA